MIVTGPNGAQPSEEPDQTKAADQTGELSPHAMERSTHASPLALSGAFSIGEQVALAATLGTQLPDSIEAMQQAAEGANLQADAHYATGTALDTKAAAFETDVPDAPPSGSSSNVGPSAFLHLAAGTLGTIEGLAHLSKIASMGRRISQLKKEYRNAPDQQTKEAIAHELDMLKHKRDDFAKSVALDDTAAFLYFGGALPPFIASTTAAGVAAASLGSVGFGAFLLAAGARDLSAAKKQEKARVLEWAHLEVKGKEWAGDSKLKKVLLRGRKNLLAQSVRKRTKTMIFRSGLKIATGAASIASGVLAILAKVGVSIAAGALAATGIGLAALIVTGFIVGVCAFAYRRRHQIKAMAQYVLHPEKREQLRPQIKMRQEVRKARKIHKAAVRTAKHLKETDCYLKAIEDVQATQAKLTEARGRLAAMKVANRTGEPDIPMELSAAIDEGDFDALVESLKGDPHFDDLEKLASRVKDKAQLKTALLEWMKSAPYER